MKRLFSLFLKSFNVYDFMSFDNLLVFIILTFVNIEANTTEKETTASWGNINEDDGIFYLPYVIY